MHYSLGVFVPKNITEDSEVKSYIEKLMAPFDESLNDYENKRGHWDFWRVGGRWDGDIVDKPNFTSFGNFGKDHEFVVNNIAPASTVKIDILYSLLTPDGEWHGTWQDQLTTEDKLALFVRYQDHNVVMVDYHS